MNVQSECTVCGGKIPMAVAVPEAGAQPGELKCLLKSDGAQDIARFDRMFPAIGEYRFDNGTHVMIVERRPKEITISCAAKSSRAFDRTTPELPPESLDEKRDRAIMLGIRITGGTEKATAAQLDAAFEARANAVSKGTRTTRELATAASKG